ncbi:cytochrome P450 [Mycolicibacterium rhodesiae]|uniref:Steroid C26-monooxygenase n=1 Tax=Mycolicibacterium rhodesiae TaxID=36814 RepID=A0A1X0IR17_MYCRH|nr:cytochrome P450 [Mycolicibacterium rhodesiae]MCV7343630.1 cytochrome P450 [Mycolicibacterium rhodesiae]ORB50932.1 cytochrome [Mycolicibacterium rhodesiae]
MTAAAEPQELLVKLLDPANRANPYPVYRQILDRSPMLIPESTLHVMSSFADCDEVLRHPDSCSDRLKSTAAQRAIDAGEQPRPFGTPGFLFLDPPDHTRLRKLVSKAFSPRVVKALEPDITTMVDDLLDKAAETSEFDAIEQLAHPLPVAVICRLLGVPIEDEPQFSSASTLLAQGLDPFATFTGEPQGLEERLKAGMWLRGYLRELLERRRAEPRDDLMSGLIAVEESGDQLTEEEIVATCNLLLIAGHETTVNLIANAILAMLRHREHWTALSADPGLAPNIIEETLRYDPPVQLASRVAGADMQIGDTRIPKGDIMMLLLAAAHRDPAVTERPDDFDPNRNPIRHLAFGHGPHFCLGAPLARMEAAVALTAVTRRFPHARLAAEPTYKPHVTLRGMARLDVAV